MKKKAKHREQAPTEGPPDDFCEWWNPSGTDALSGASVGGHPDAIRTWARPESHGRFARRHYGISAVLAWTAAPYRQEYHEWVRNGRPERNPFVSMAATVKRQSEFWTGLKGLLPSVGRPMPKPQPRDWDQGKAPHVEPIDEQTLISNSI
jgi:hypothetical protein